MNTLSQIQTPAFADLQRNGVPKPTMLNTRVAIEALGIDCRLDVFHGRYLVNGTLLEQFVGELSDPIARKLRELCRFHFDFDPGVQAANDGLLRACEQHRFDPMQDYLDGLVWDGVPRLEQWLIHYCSADDTPLNRAIGRIVLVAAVRRIRDHGCKFDHVMVWESPEGFNKSSAIRILAGGAENFSDQTILGVDDRKQQELTKGVWFYEIAEMSGMKKADVDHIKAFVTRQEDRARPAYARFQEIQPRRCIFIGSVNPGGGEYLTSTTGNRRFWPVPVKMIDLDALQADRDQLFAEAVIEEGLLGTPISLDPDLWAAAGAEQDARVVKDLWADKLATLDREVIDLIDEQNKRSRSEDRETADYCRLADGRLWVSSKYVTEQLPVTNDGRRIAEVMHKLGWARAKRRYAGKQIRGYARDIETAETAES